MAEPPDAFGYSIFCDDIRHEVGNKITCVGIYPNVMYVHSDFPFTLPKFAISVTYTERLALETKGSVPVHVFLPGQEEPFLTGEIPVEEMRGAVPTQELDLPNMPKPQFGHFRIQVVFAPLVLNEPGYIKVQAVREGDEIKLGVLKVIPAPQAQP
jgi:hypothetical protein